MAILRLGTSQVLNGIGSIPVLGPLRAVAKNLRIHLSRFESLEKLSRVGLDIDVATQETLKVGNVLRALLRQGRLSPRGIAEQVIALTAVSEQWLKDVMPQHAVQVLNVLLAAHDGEPPLIRCRIIVCYDWTR